MFDRDRWKEIYESLTANKIRTVLTAFGVGWGILMLILMIGAGNGLEKGVKREMSGMATNSVFMWGRSTSIPYKGFREGRWVRFNNRDIDALRSQVPEIEHLSPSLQLGGWRGGNNVSYGNKIGAFEVNGYLPVAKNVKLINDIEGRFINQKDIDEMRKVVVIGERVWEVLFNRSHDFLGKHITILGLNFQVVGKFKSSRYGDSADRENQSVYIPFTTFQRSFNQGDRVGWFILTSKPEISATVVEKKAREVLKRMHNIHPEDERAIGGWNAEEEFNAMNMVFTGIRVLGWIVGIMTLLAGIIGISNIMLVIIRERTKEIGIRRSIGARPSNIIVQIVLEALTLTFFAGTAGFMVGVGILEVLGSQLEHDAFTNPEIDIWVSLSALSLLIISGLIAGIMPAVKAVKIRPIEALRGQ